MIFIVWLIAILLLQCNGKEISWSHLCRLYNLNRSNKAPGYAMITKLKYEHIVLTSYSKMRVDLATQVTHLIN